MPELTLEFAGQLLANRLNFEPYFGYGYENHARAFSYWNYLVFNRERAPFGYRDSEGKKVVFFSSVDEQGNSRVFKAYRNYLDELHFVNEPAAPPFLGEDEVVHSVVGLGTYYIVLALANGAGFFTRAVLVKTTSSDWDDWTDYVVLDEYTYGSSFYYDHKSGNYIKVWSENDGTEIWYCLFDENFSYLIAPTQLMDTSTDINYTDDDNLYEYDKDLKVSPYGLSVTYDRTNEEMVILASSTVRVLDTRAGSYKLLGKRIILNFSMAESTLTDGVGLVLNNIPYNTDDHYKIFDPAGNADGYCHSDEMASVGFDEYYEGGMSVTDHDWNSFGFIQTTTASSGETLRGCTSPIDHTVVQFAFITAGIPCALSVEITTAMTTAGSWLIPVGYLGGAVTVPTALKLSEIDGDVLVPDVGSIHELPYETSYAGKCIYEVTKTTTVMFDEGLSKSYGLEPLTNDIMLIFDHGDAVAASNTMVELPEVPNAFISFESWTWNGDPDNPTFYYLVSPKSLNGTHKQHTPQILRYHEGDPDIGWGAGWTLFNSELDAEGMAESGAMPPMPIQVMGGNSGGGGSIYTHKGHVVFVTQWDGDEEYTKPTVSVFDPETDSIVHSFRVGPNNNGPTGIGWHQSMGYFYASSTQSTHLELQAQDLDTYEDFFSGNSSTRYKLVVPRSSGPHIIIKKMPVFVGGRFNDMQHDVNLSLELHKTNYVYVERSLETPFNLNFFVTDQLMPNNFHRALLAEVVCDAHGPVSQKTHKANWKA